MQVITAITAQKRNDERVNIYLDGTFAFSQARVTAAYLRTDQPLSPEEIARLRLEDEYERAKDGALRLITQRPRSVAEVRRRLSRKDFASETIDRVVDRLQELDLLDDRAFARYWVEQRENFKPRSPMALRQELHQKGVSRTIIDAVVADVDAEEAARQAAVKRVGRWQGLDEADFRHKMTGYLQRRGFNFEITRQITDEMWRQAQSEIEGDN